MNTFDRPWIAFFSQTGSEIMTLMSSMGVIPDAIVSNRHEFYCEIDPRMRDAIHKKQVNLIKLPKSPTVKDYESALKGFETPLVTLHGYLRILPPEICKRYEIYNLHPGLITEYPELKGKDPQKRAIEGGYPKAGCVIHKVIPEVDEGEIIDSHAIWIHDYSEIRLFSELKSLGVIMWEKFLKNYVKPGDN